MTTLPRLFMAFCLLVGIQSEANTVELPTYSELDGKTFVLNTGDEIARSSSFSAESVEINDDIAGQIRDLPLVTYETDADLVGNVPFVGLPNHTYEIRYTIQRNYLRVEKVAFESEVTPYELALARSLPDGRVAVPMMMYEVGFSNTMRNNRGTLIEVATPSPTQDSNVRIYKLRRHLVNWSTVKEDLLPVDYFLGETTQWAGEWYYSTSVIDSLNGEAQLNTDREQTNISATKIKFVKDKDQLRAVDMNIDNRMKELLLDNRLSSRTVLSIPVQWTSYMLLDTELEENHSLHWSKRDYVNVDFEDTRVISDEVFNLGQAKKLTSLTFSKESFSFTLLHIDSGVLVRHSFAKVKK